jgi:hypothetical protein
MLLVSIDRFLPLGSAREWFLPGGGKHGPAASLGGKGNVGYCASYRRDGLAVKKADRKHSSLLANLGDLNRPVRVRPVHVEGRDWWAIDPEDIWPGMVMDLRRLGFESMAWGEEVLVREGLPAYEPEMEGPADQRGLKPFPVIHPTIQIRRDPYSSNYPDLSYLDEYSDEDEEIEEDEIEPDEDFQYE